MTEATTRVDSHTNAFKNIETQAYVLNEVNADFELQDILLDEVRPNEVLIEMKFAVICHTDIIAQQGAFPLLKFPAILGYEGAGYVRSIGSDVRRSDFAVGDFVLLSFNYCRSCKQCRRSLPNVCSEGGRLHSSAVSRSDGSSPARLKKDGQEVRSQYFGSSSFANMTVIDSTSVAMKYPYDPSTAWIFTACGCGFQTGAGTVLNRLKPQSDDTIAIFGVGGVGLTTLMAAQYLNVKQIIAVDIVDSRLEFARELRATDLVNSKSTSDFVAKIQNLTGGVGVDYAIDCSGNMGVLHGILDCVARNGTAVAVGVPPPNQKVEVDPCKLLLQGKAWNGVLEGDSHPPKFIPKLVEMQRNGDLPLEKLCTLYSCKEFQQALDDARAGKVIKSVIEWS